jgi:hypothetical protein
MEDSNEFQIKNMLYKMKKIKKKRKYDNIQKIEPFEVLENNGNPDSIFFTPSRIVCDGARGDVTLPSVPAESPTKGGWNRTTKEGMENKDQINNRFKNLFTEKKDESNEYADPTVKYTRENEIDPNEKRWWDGLDEVKSELGDLKKGGLDDLSDFINDVYVAIITFNCMIALTLSTGKPKGSQYIKSNNVVNVELANRKKKNNNPIVKGDSELTDNDVKDANIIFRWICNLEALIAAYFFTNIWFYIIFYSYAENISLNSIFDGLTRDKLKENTSPLMQFIVFFIEYAVIILDDIRWVLSYLIPKYIGKVLSKPLCFILLFVVIYIFNHEFLSNFKNLLIDTLKRNMHTNIIIIFFYLIAIGEYIKTFKPKNINSDDPIAKASASLDILNTYLSNNMITLIFKFLKEVLRLIVILAVAVPLGTFLFIIYFFWTSIITGFSKIFSSDLLNEIVRFIRSDSTYKGRDPCDIPRTYFEQLWLDIKDGFTNLSMFMFSNLYYIKFILYSLSVLGASSYINNTQAQQGLMISHIIILGFTLFAWFSAIMKYRKVDTTGLRGLFIEPPDQIFIEVFRYSMYTSGFFLLLIVFFAILFFIVGISKTR